MKEIGFFEDIRAKLFGLVVGLGSVFVVLPSFFNQLHEFFGFDNIHGAYCLFIVLYFAVPAIGVVFLIINSKTYKDTAVQSSLSKWLSDITALIISISGIVILFALIIWLFFTNDNRNSLTVYACLVILLLILLIGLDVLLSRNYSKSKIKNEHFIILVISGLLLVLYFCNFFNKEFKGLKVSNSSGNIPFEAYKSIETIRHLNNSVSDVAQSYRKDFWQQKINSLSEDQSPLPGTRDNLKENLEQYKLSYRLDSLSFFSNKFSDTAVIYNSFTANMKSLVHSDSSFRVTLKDIRDKTAHLVTLDENKTRLLADYFDNMGRITAYLVNRHEKIIGQSYWVPMLKRLQFKGLLLFVLLLKLLTSLWFTLMLADLKKEEKEKLSPAKVTRDGDGFSITEKETHQPNPALNSTKNFIYFILLLALPFFKPISSESFQFDKPFIPTSQNLPNLLSSDKEPDVRKEINQINDRLTIIEVVEVPGIWRKLNYTFDGVDNIDTIMNVAAEKPGYIKVFRKNWENK